MERIGQHMRNILAINFGGNPIPEGIDKYLKEQIAFINDPVKIPIPIIITLSLP